MKKPAVLSLILLATGSLLLPGCVGFDQAWNKAVAEYSAGNTSAPLGPWTGKWETSTNGHSGDLRCIVTPAAGEPGTYNYRYHATWANFLSGQFDVKFSTQRYGNSYKVDGEHDLGLFGKFRHKANISGSRFQATYEKNSGEEVGKFQMTRPN